MTATKPERSVSSTTRSNAKKSSSLVKSSLRPTPRLSTWKTIPPENVASVVTFTAFYQDIPALSIWWLSPCHLFWCQDIPVLSIWWLSPFLVMSPFLVNEFVGHGQELSRFRGHW